MSMVLTTIGATVLAVALEALVVFSSERFGWSDEVEHAVSHALFGSVMALLLVAALQVWPPPRATSLARAGRVLLAAGLAVFTLGQFVEGSGAFGYDGDTRVRPTVALLHDIGLVVGMVGLLVVAAGIVVALLATAAQRAGSLGIGEALAGGVVLAAIVGMFTGVLSPVAAITGIIGVVVVVLGRRLVRRPSAA
jgi:hypothetical protein